MDNVILVTFEDEGKAYEEFNHLKDNEATADFTILEMAVVKNVDGAIMVPDGYQDGYDETDNTAFGGVIGAVVGLLGGPVGVLLGAGIGLVAGMAMDDKDIDDDDSLMEYCASELTPGATARVPGEAFSCDRRSRPSSLRATRPRSPPRQGRRRAACRRLRPYQIRANQDRRLPARGRSRSRRNPACQGLRRLGTPSRKPRRFVPKIRPLRLLSCSSITI